MRRWIVFAALFFAACGGETPDTTTAPAAPNPRKEAPVVTTTTPPAAAPVLVPHAANKSTPQRCAGDGSYVQALDCFRISAGFPFQLSDAHGVVAKGEMTRTTPGMERVQFKASDGASWVGESTKAGVVWIRNGKHELSPPEITNIVWQRTTMVLDPQKKEGAAQFAASGSLGHETLNHYHFTNANSGEANDVWVSTRDGRLVKWTAGPSTLQLQ